MCWISDLVLRARPHVEARRKAHPWSVPRLGVDGDGYGLPLFEPAAARNEEERQQEDGPHGPVTLPEGAPRARKSGLRLGLGLLGLRHVARLHAAERAHGRRDERAAE